MNIKQRFNISNSLIEAVKRTLGFPNPPSANVAASGSQVSGQTVYPKGSEEQPSSRAGLTQSRDVARSPQVTGVPAVTSSMAHSTAVERKSEKGLPGSREEGRMSMCTGKQVTKSHICPHCHGTAHTWEPEVKMGSITKLTKVACEKCAGIGVVKEDIGGVGGPFGGAAGNQGRGTDANSVGGGRLATKPAMPGGSSRPKKVANTFIMKYPRMGNEAVAEDSETFEQPTTREKMKGDQHTNWPPRQAKQGMRLTKPQKKSKTLLQTNEEVLNEEYVDAKQLLRERGYHEFGSSDNGKGHTVSNNRKGENDYVEVVGQDNKIINWKHDHVLSNKGVGTVAHGNTYDSLKKHLDTLKEEAIDITEAYTFKPPKCPNCGSTVNITGGSKEGTLHCPTCKHEGSRTSFTQPKTTKEAVESLMTDAGFVLNETIGSVVITGNKDSRYFRHDDHNVLKIELDENVGYWARFNKKGECVANGKGFDTLLEHLAREDFAILKEMVQEAQEIADVVPSYVGGAPDGVSFPAEPVFTPKHEALLSAEGLKIFHCLACNKDFAPTDHNAKVGALGQPLCSHCGAPDVMKNSGHNGYNIPSKINPNQPSPLHQESQGLKPVYDGGVDSSREANLPQIAKALQHGGAVHEEEKRDLPKPTKEFEKKHWRSTKAIRNILRKQKEKEAEKGEVKEETDLHEVTSVKVKKHDVHVKAINKRDKNNLPLYRVVAAGKGPKAFGVKLGDEITDNHLDDLHDMGYGVKTVTSVANRKHVVRTRDKKRVKVKLPSGRMGWRMISAHQKTMEGFEFEDGAICLEDTQYCQYCDNEVMDTEFLCEAHCDAEEIKKAMKKRRKSLKNVHFGESFPHSLRKTKMWDKEQEDENERARDAEQEYFQRTRKHGDQLVKIHSNQTQKAQIANKEKESEHSNNIGESFKGKRIRTGKTRVKSDGVPSYGEPSDKWGV